MHFDDDDLPIGRILTRRDAIRLLAIGGAAVAVGCKPGGQNVADTSMAGEVTTTGGSAAGALPQCVAKPELTVGPYFLDKQLNRSDIRSDPTTNAIKAGAPLVLTFNVQQIANGACSPLAGVMVDVWQCDAEGQYSGFNDRMVGFNTTGQRFLRGYQVTDPQGVARFLTIYPGWYPGRAVHIHFKLRTPAEVAISGPADTAYEFTSQLFFDESVTDRAHAKAPYAAKGQRDLRNQNDGIFRQSGGGDTLLLATQPDGEGYNATFDIGLDLSDTRTGQPDGQRRGGPGGRRRPPGNG